MSKSPMTKTPNTIIAQPSDEVYSVFQSEADPLSETSASREASSQGKLGTLGFFGRMIEGVSIVALSLTVAFLTMTTGAQAETTSMLSSATGDYATATMVAVSAVFAIMLVMLRKTWRQTSKTIAQAPRRSHRIS